MIFLIAGASHAGKTALAQRLLEQYHYPYLSIDHLKMGLIRSGNTSLTPTSEDGALTGYLWPIVREIIKTAIENGQNLIVEGCYIPFDWADSFEADYLRHIKYCCLVLSEGYIRSHYEEIKRYACVVEQRLDDSQCTMESLIRDHAEALQLCRQYGVNDLLIDGSYCVDAAFSGPLPAAGEAGRPGRRRGTQGAADPGR